MIAPQRDDLLDYKFDHDLRVWKRIECIQNFEYSDGDNVETNIYNIFKNAEDRSLESKIIKDNIIDWPTLYHLSPIRANLLRPVRNQIKGKVLEIGAGCGAITRFLGESEHDVIALEGSLRRSSIIAERCAELDNITVVADTIDQFSCKFKFDTIILIGVLEYARIYFPSGHGEDSIDALLACIRTHLNPGGVLIVAIENQLGLKYFAGIPEDHTGTPFFGIEDRYSEKTAVTFGRQELTGRMSEAGFPFTSYWFPFPDYKLPRLMISEAINSTDLKFDFSSMIEGIDDRDVQFNKVGSFKTRRAWRPVVRNKLFADLSNSFLVLASDAQFDSHDDLIFYYSGMRRAEFQKDTIVRRTSNGIVVDRKRRAITGNIQEINSLSMVCQTEAWVDGSNWHLRLLDIVSEPGWNYEQLFTWSKKWWEVLGTSEKLVQSDPDKSDEADHLIYTSGDLIDAVPRNLVISGEHAVFIDQEWVLNRRVEKNYILFRGLLSSFLDTGVCASPMDAVNLNISDLIQRISKSLCCELTHDQMQKFWLQEVILQETVHGEDAWSEINFSNLKLKVESNNTELENYTDAATRSIDMLSSLMAGIKIQSKTLIDITSGFSDAFEATDKIISELKASVDFDSSWYLSFYADVKSSGMDPFNHYMLYGRKEGRLPHG